MRYLVLGPALWAAGAVGSFAWAEGEVILFPGGPAPTVTRAQPLRAHSQLAVLATADGLVDAMLSDYAAEAPESRRENVVLIGEPIAKAWAGTLPDPIEALPRGIGFLTDVAGDAKFGVARGWAEDGLRAVIDVLASHARAPEHFVQIDRAIDWLARIDSKLAISALANVAREAYEPAARTGATHALMKLAKAKRGRRYEERIAEACALLLLE